VGEDEASTAKFEEEQQMAETSTKGEVKDGEPKAKYWISERATGSFSRQFSFPQPVDSDAVKASLKNGILSIVVPLRDLLRRKNVSQSGRGMFPAKLSLMLFDRCTLLSPDWRDLTFSGNSRDDLCMASNIASFLPGQRT